MSICKNNQNCVCKLFLSKTNKQKMNLLNKQKWFVKKNISSLFIFFLSENRTFSRKCAKILKNSLTFYEYVFVVRGCKTPQWKDWLLLLNGRNFFFEKYDFFTKTFRRSYSWNRVCRLLGVYTPKTLKKHILECFWRPNYKEKNRIFSKKFSLALKRNGKPCFCRE